MSYLTTCRCGCVTYQRLDDGQWRCAACGAAVPPQPPPPATPLDALGEPTMAEMVASTKAHIKNLDSVREAGRRAERADVVAYYRKCEAACRKEAERSVLVGTQRMWRGQADVHASSANAIERGDHLSTPTEKPPGERR